MKKSLKTKLGLMFFIFISIPLIASGVFSCIKTSDSMQELTEGSLKQIAERTVESISLAVESVNDYIRALSLDEDFANIALGDNKLHSSGLEYLAKLQKENNDTIENLFITDINAKGVISNDNEDYDFSDRDYVKQALKGSRAQSGVFKSKKSGGTIIAIAYPLMLDNKVVGAIVATIKFEKFYKHVAEIKIGQSGYAYMIDKSGLFVYHPENEKVLKENLVDTNNAELKALVNKMKAGEAGEGYYKYEGKRKFIRFTPVENWVVVVTANYDDYMAPVVAIKKNIIAIALISLFIAMLLSYFFTTKKIIEPIKILQKLMVKAGEGDLTVRAEITTKDEIQTLGECFNLMIKDQSDIISRVRSGAKELAAASEEISASTEEITSSTEQIAENIQNVAFNAENQNNSIMETSEVLVQLSSLVQIAENKALIAKNNSQDTVSAAKQGRTKVKETVEAIENINKTSMETEVILKVLNELSKKVSGIINTINNISSQTNLLALNAAIEAARAGEHGKGFTVVADEVRKLSEQTNTRANEISSLINEMVVQIDRAVDSMHFGKEAVEHGAFVAKETDETFVSIINAIEQISRDINKIADIKKDEVASSEQIVKLIDSVATITEITATSSEEVAASAQEQISVIESLASSSEQTSAMANNLNSLVAKFMI
ncbi:methyl-accepting chemotaxis protein [Clostridium tagluense]|uniref:methyl-accepting chemotaxis protein n=1 Tax=Clostridium tagluense TaxID=360422 RepID=UPI001C0BBBF6|nr:methyl-accepting chemotaxis protein [Clostridium tagluense]MBU3129817.1 methyl-accepting chemotaxis protein [Clostridium tagluense]MCB2314191.1 methyl-accepting chemotaxis protein [Clostridium tagluense]MCB2319060.1 methyl-accepting chemotaxis protein [Clostridium tagluense]MCB2323928.1 methyl-accepting chemotaxis protein [Clostridium tagluense]MCB2328787.1 methyl-accepting chemotaxis protein [Clostridium tagluense]